jgi:hypothetical protein
MRIPKKGPAFPKIVVELSKEAPDVLLKGADPSVRRLVEQANNEGWN